MGRRRPACVGRMACGLASALLVACAGGTSADVVAPRDATDLPPIEDARDVTPDVPVPDGLLPWDVPPVEGLAATPNPIDFGVVDVGTTRDVILANLGTTDVLVSTISLRPDGSPDFTVEGIHLFGGGVLPAYLVPGDSMRVTLAYTPAHGGADSSSLVVAGSRAGSSYRTSFVIRGEEKGPRLVASPSELDFQVVAPGTKKTLPLEVRNTGTADLTIPPNGVILGWNANLDLRIENPVIADLRIGPGESHEFDIAWTPAAAVPDDGTPLGQVQITSDDKARGQVTIPMHGIVDAPLLAGVPAAVDMGLGARQTPVERQVTLRNVGHAVLKVVGVTLGDVSDTTHGGEFQILHGAEQGLAVGPFDVAGGGSDTVRIVFTNQGPDQGTVTATLRITTNDPVHGTVDVPITVGRTGVGVCEIALAPSNLDLGTVAIGSSLDRAIDLVNTGSGYCSFVNAGIADCSTGTFGDAVCGAPFAGPASSIFRLVNLPPVSVNGLAPGSATTLTVRFQPPQASPLFGNLNRYAALLAVQVRDEARQMLITLPKGTGTPSAYPANLLGSSGTSRISVLPGEARFGTTTIGCGGGTRKLCIYTAGNGPLIVGDVRLDGCSPEFTVRGLPKLPVSVGIGSPECLEVGYVPQDEGADSCWMRIDSSDPSSPAVVVRLAGGGAQDARQVDSFTQVTGEPVDILFVIDDSGSMAEEQDRLTGSFAEFIARAELWKNDFHLGGISVNVTDDAVAGRLNRGDTGITPRFMTTASKDAATFAKMVDYGSSGGSDAQEAGLAAAQAALSPPLTTDTGLPCASDTDCRNEPGICPSAAACPYHCIEGTCGGFNARFLRDDARLELVVLSDEEDQSASGLPLYADFFQGLKGGAFVDRMHVNAIVGIRGMPALPGSGEDGACIAADGGTAQAGDRYLELAAETGGLAGSICDSSYSGIMEEIGAAAFRPKVQFFLTRAADPATISVQVNGAACTAGWRPDAPSNSVVFDPKGSCMPRPGDTIRVEYDAVCLEP